MRTRGGPPGAGCELTILMPCLDEARTIAGCLDKARGFLERAGIDGELVVADNGSRDGSVEIAARLGARVVPVGQRGYGAALIGGIAAARGRYVIMGDADGSYDFGALERFVAALRDGCDLVMGNRFWGGIEPGAMPKLHRYFGNPVLSAIGRLFFRAPCRDFHCGLRGFRRDAIRALDLQARGMEFASEMVVKATVAGLRITEVPTVLSRDGREGDSHLRPWRDGWRHLRFLLVFSPRWLFLVPGIGLSATGFLGMVWLLPGPRAVGSVTFDIHTLYYCSLAVVVGVQAVLFWVFAKIHGERERIVPPDPLFRSVVRAVPLEAGLLVGVALLMLGLALAGLAIGAWGADRFGNLSPTRAMRLIIPSGTAILLAFQIAMASFFVSVLDVRALLGGIPDPGPARSPGRPAQRTRSSRTRPVAGSRSRTRNQ
jgi:glycosyltransferase involved in cell wall biosynthesis